jgi:Na+-transporting NADH:ubiquinone oxidoreductase subunit B
MGFGDVLWGREPGAPGETSALACLLGAALLLQLRLASWRIVVGGVLGLVITAAAANAFADPERPLVGMPVHWHLATGGFAFALAFLATDPVTSAHTRGGRWALGLWIGFFVVLVRVFNPAHREGVLMAVLLGNVLAPFFDHVAVRAWARRRRRRLG